MNQVTLLGRLAADPEQRTTNSGSACARFRVACDRRDKEGGADFIGVVAFGKTAELICQYIHKGDPILVTGSIRTGSYEKDGRKVYTTDVWADRFEFVPRSGNGSGSGKQQQDDGYTTDYDGEIPF